MSDFSPSSTAQAVPAGMIEVTRDDFWAAVMAETRNIHPSPEKFSTDWMLVGTKHRWGWSSAGYVRPCGAAPERFALTREQGGAA